MKKLVSILLSLCLGLFLADAVVSLADDTLILFFDIHIFSTIRGILFFFDIILAIVIYFLIGFTPMIPKRLFLPVTLFNPVAALVAVPFLIYYYGRIQQMAWVISFCQVLFGFGILYWLLGGFNFRWPLVAEKQLEGRRFSGRNLTVFLLVNVFVFLPAAFLYLAYCASLAVDHFSGSFLALRPDGLTVQVRKYVRNDGKTIHLIPMSHIGESDFYHQISQSFPTNCVILMEGVTDNKNLITNKLTYKRMATSLGLSEQQEKFEPSRGEMVQADVDVGQFSADTIGLLNLVSLVHAKGLNAETVLKLMQYSPPPHFEEQLFDDLLTKRNQHVLEVIEAELPQSENIMVPWGVAHMPEIAKEIQKSGFCLAESQEYKIINFRSVLKNILSNGKSQSKDHNQ